jgi:hypothetical protein
MFAPGVPTAAAVSNDVRANTAQIFVPDPDLTGVRRRAERVNGLPVDPDVLTGGSDDEGDPPLLQPVPPEGLQPFSNCPDRGSVMAEPTRPEWFASRTAWYELTRDSTGAPFSQSTLVTIDSAGSSFAAALEVFSGSAPPVAFDPAAPVLPTNIVACDRNTLASIPALVSFVATPGLRYFLMAGLYPAGSFASNNASLRLSMRILDIQTPKVAISLPNTPDVSDMFSYTVSSDDGVLTKLTVTQRKGLKGPLRPDMKRVSLGAQCDKNHLKTGQYCRLGNSVRVRWRGVGRDAEFGTVMAEYTDRAGNVGSNSLRTQLRDRRPPTLVSARAHWTQRGRLFVAATCRSGPGSIEVQVGTGKKSLGRARFTRSTMRLLKVFPKVTRRTTFIHLVCRDRSNNADDTWLFLPA